MIKPVFLKESDRIAVEAFREKVSRLLGDKLVKIALFGSKATGKDTLESDIDILVLISDSMIGRKDDILDLAFEVNLKHGVYISPRVIPLSVFNNPIWSMTPFLRNLKSASIAL